MRTLALGPLLLLLLPAGGCCGSLWLTLACFKRLEMDLHDGLLPSLQGLECV